jgi:hypothetical protein
MYTPFLSNYIQVYLILVVLNMLFQLVSAIALMVLPDYCGVNICAREFTVNKGVLQIVFVVFQIWNVFDGVRCNSFVLLGMLVVSDEGHGAAIQRQPL